MIMMYHYYVIQLSLRFNLLVGNFFFFFIIFCVLWNNDEIHLKSPKRNYNVISKDAKTKRYLNNC
jgi:hypothetical protein